MTQMVSRAGTLTPPTGVVSVADLLNRYAPDPLIEAEPSTGPVSVGTLLRREGRAPHAVDRPVRARDEDDEPRRGSGALVRRSAIAAGTLLAAGSVFGAAVMTESAVTDTADDSRSSGEYAGEGRLDLLPGQGRAIPTVVDNTAQTNPLDPGEAAPMSWTGVAFPGAGSGTPAAPPVASSSAPTGGGAPAASSSGSTSTDRGTTGGTGTPVESPSGGGSGSGDQGGDEDPGASDERSGLGGAVQNVGDAAGVPLVGDLGRAVSGVGDALGGGSPSVVGGLAGGLL
ncbi:hypothetical protein [Pseudonocardia abyssalis]|uniref:Uncharacterized protein n=1 Tax=Pseudonocardia abyssalis TaxID=2792008 RepID=A0ABS6V1L3_9PSEU|nr:hypothetical protein [Pseudonocardia abyssalis]MBW0116464.1 hypothetical protein [Pseudonocardia abyssalis]MBW0138146.1 hypothetical protein [Pseudonocardia abyssalis]